MAARRSFSGNPYDVLGVARTADMREIRTAYRRLAKKHHPDVSTSPDAAEQMARINWAYGVAAEHARREGSRAYRGASHAATSRTGRVRWFVRERPPPAGGKLVVETRRVLLHGLRGESANVEGLAMVRNDGVGPIEGEARTTPAWVIVTPKQFGLEASGVQMFRISVPNRYCTDRETEVTLILESNGGDDKIVIGVPAAAEVLIALEPTIVDLGEVEPGGVREARLRLSYRGRVLPRMTLSSSAPWVTVGSTSMPRRTQYFRVRARAPEAPGPHSATVTATAGDAQSTVLVRLSVAIAEVERQPAEQEPDDRV